MTNITVNQECNYKWFVYMEKKEIGYLLKNNEGSRMLYINGIQLGWCNGTGRHPEIVISKRIEDWLLHTRNTLMSLQQEIRMLSLDILNVQSDRSIKLIERELEQTKREHRLLLRQYSDVLKVWMP